MCELGRIFNVSCWTISLPFRKCVALVIDGFSGSGGKREIYYICQELKAFTVYTYASLPSPQPDSMHCVSMIFKAPRGESRGKK